MVFISLSGAIGKWQGERHKMGTVGASTAQSNVLCERIVVLGKKDLVGQWGVQVCINSPFFSVQLWNRGFFNISFVGIAAG